MSTDIERRLMKWHTDYLALAKFWALRKSKDPSTKVAAIIVRPDRSIVSMGYNGFPRGVKDDDRLNHRTQKYPRVVHAEDNALLTARESLQDCSIYTWPMPPCSACTGRIIQAGIKYVYAPEPEERWLESCTMGFDMFKEAGVMCAWFTPKMLKGTQENP